MNLAGSRTNQRVVFGIWLWYPLKWPLGGRQVFKLLAWVGLAESGTGRGGRGFVFYVLWYRPWSDRLRGS